MVTEGKHRTGFESSIIILLRFRLKSVTKESNGQFAASNQSPFYLIAVSQQSEGTRLKQFHCTPSAHNFRSQCRSQFCHNTLQALGIGDLTRLPPFQILHIHEHIPYQ